MLAIGTQLGVALVFENKMDVQRVADGLKALVEQINDAEAKDRYIYLQGDDNIEGVRHRRLLESLEKGRVPTFLDLPVIAYTCVSRGH